MSLTYSHDPSQRPMYKGLRAREGYSFSLTSPSLFLFEHSRQVGISLTEKRRVTHRETTFLSSRNDELFVAVEKQKIVGSQNCGPQTCVLRKLFVPLQYYASTHSQYK
jgi:hypothetical protein